MQNPFPRAVVATLLLAAACTSESAPPPTTTSLEDDPIDVQIFDAPATAARFASEHPELPASEQLTKLRIRVFFDANTQTATYDVDGLTDDLRDKYRVTLPDGTVVEEPMPGWTIDPTLGDALEIAGDHVMQIGEQNLDDLDGVIEETQSAIAAAQVGGFGNYFDEVTADAAAYAGIDATDDDDGGDDGGGGDPGDPGDPGGGGGGGGTLGGGGGGASPKPGSGGGNSSHEGTVAHDVAQTVCAVNFAGTVAAHLVAMVATARAIMVQVPRTVKVCSAVPFSFPACALEMVRLNALFLVEGGLVVLLRMHVTFHGQVNQWVNEIEQAGIGQQANAEAANAAVANARGVVMKRLTTSAEGFALVWGPVAVAAGLSLYPSVVKTVLAAVTLSATFIGCSYYVCNPFWQNAGVKVQAQQGAPANNGGGNLWHGFGFPADDERPPPITPVLTSLPPALAVAQQINVDLQSNMSPFGMPQNNLSVPFTLQSQGEYWGMGLCSKLVPDFDAGGPYYHANGDLMQQANTPYYNFSSGWADGWWGDGIKMDSTIIPTKYATLTQQRVCDGDDNNDGIPDAGQPDGIDNNNNGVTDEAGETNSFCFDRNPVDGLEDLYSVSLDSQMPNRYPNRSKNCGGVGLDLIPKPQINTIPGSDPRATLQQQVGRQVEQTTIVHLTSPYRNKVTGAKIGESGMLRFKVTGVLHTPTDPCVKYDQIYDPSGNIRYGWVWDYTRSGCEYGPGGGGGPGGPPI